MTVQDSNTGAVTMAVPEEIEAKLLVEHAGAFRALAGLQQIGPYRVRPRDTVRLRSTYFDTDEFTLARHGVALRLRRAGEAWEVTAKWSGGVEGLVHHRPELTVRLPSKPRLPLRLPPQLRLHLDALVAGRRLRPILRTDITRRRLDIMPSAGDQAPVLAELALDRVRLRAPGRRPAVQRYEEVEIELHHGSARQVAELAGLLQQRFSLEPSESSKFARGIALLYGTDVQRGAPPHVRVGHTLAQATRAVIGVQLERLRQHDPGTRLREDPEALHDMRVATRRLRAAVRAFREGMPAGVQAAFTAELRWLGHLLGAVRDLDVQIGLLDAYCDAARPQQASGVVAFRRYLNDERARHQEEMLAALNSERYFRFLIDLEHFTSGSSVDATLPEVAAQPIGVVGTRAIRRAFRRLVKCGDAMGAGPSDSDLHALRIRAKRLRYLLEFLDDLTGGPGRRLVKYLIRLQDLLGAHQDAVVSAGLVRRYVEGPGASAPAADLLALGGFEGAQLRQADALRADFEKAWRRFTRRRTRRGVRDLLAKLGDHEAVASISTNGDDGSTLES